MATLCYITTCKGRLGHLQQTLPRVVDQPDVACVVVDYACPDHAADWVARHYPQVTVVRVTGEAGFSAARARNLGAQAADAPWLAFFDADIVWSPQLASTVIPNLQAGCFYRASPLTLQSWGSVICRRQDFEAIGGYDEAFCGWGGEDDDLLARLVMLGRTPAGFAATLIAEIAHDDEARVRFHEVKDRALQHRINMLYLQAKLDLLRLLGGPLPLQTRKELFGEVRRTLRQAADAGHPAATLSVHLPANLVSPPPINGSTEHWRIKRNMVYSIDIAAVRSERTRQP